MSSQEKITEFGKKIKEVVSLHTFPLGIKFCKDAQEAEKIMAEIKARRPLTTFNVRMPVCQVINISRTHRWTLGMTLEDMWCIGGALMMGLLDEYPEYLAELVKPHSKDVEAGKAIFETLEKRYLPLKSTYAVLVGPLEIIKFEPDVSVIYGTPTQIARIAKAFTWWGIIPEMKFAGLAACSFISNAYLTGKPQINIACGGEIMLGRTEENEIGIAFPTESVDKLLSGLDGTKFIFPYPPAKFSLYEPKIPEGYRITYKDYMEWKAQKRKGT